MKRILFIDRDGTLIKEAPPTYQLDSLANWNFIQICFFVHAQDCGELDYELVMVTNQDGLGTASFPEDTFGRCIILVMTSLVNENIHFSEVCIDRSFPDEHKPTRKPGTGMLTKYLNNPAYDIANSFVMATVLQICSWLKIWAVKVLVKCG